MLVAQHLAYLGSSLTDTLDIQGLALYLSQFDTEATQLHLGIDTAHILYLSVVIPTAEVAGVVHAYRTPPAVLFHKRTINKRLSCALRQSPIAATYLHTCKTQLASHTLWH